MNYKRGMKLKNKLYSRCRIIIRINKMRKMSDILKERLNL